MGEPPSAARVSCAPSECGGVPQGYVPQYSKAGCYLGCKVARLVTGPLAELFTLSTKGSGAQLALPPVRGPPHGPNPCLPAWW